MTPSRNFGLSSRKCGAGFGDNVLFVHDNTSPLLARMINDYLDEVDIEVLE